MNPFLDIITPKKGKEINKPGLIGIGSSAGGGKSIALNTMILGYIQSGINVILFSEQHHSYSQSVFRQFICDNRNDNYGILFMHGVVNGENSIESFHKKLKSGLEFLIGTTVVIIDGPMFEDSLNSFQYENELTRLVLFEKFNHKIHINYKENLESNKFVKTQRNIASMRDLAINNNTHVIVTNQHRNKLVSPNVEPNIRDQVTNTTLLYACDRYLSISKEDEGYRSVFNIRRLKDRYSSDFYSVKCIFNQNSFTFETIK